jgi:mRNA interferase RelE/StbE
MFTLYFKHVAKKQLNRLPRKQKIYISEAIERLKQDPYCGNKLEGDLAGVYSMRVWPYRVLYEIHKDRVLVIIVNIGHRQGAYK